jgi:hypothetical protein
MPRATTSWLAWKYTGHAVEPVRAQAAAFTIVAFTGTLDGVLGRQRPERDAETRPQTEPSRHKLGGVALQYV